MSYTSGANPVMELFKFCFSFAAQTSLGLQPNHA